MNIHELRQRIENDIIDYNQLKDALADYVHPRGKIYEWLRSGDLIRIKKGLYVFGRHVSKTPYSLELLANLIYGPSALSLHYALSYYGLIPESVHAITSITNKRNKVFDTALGQFSYRYCHPEQYTIGIQLLTNHNGENFLIATPEKALCDVVALNVKNILLKTQNDFENFLFADMRMDEALLKKMDMTLITAISEIYASRRLKKFTRHFANWMKSQ